AFVHDVDRLVAQLNLVTHAVVVFDDIQRNIHAQHARRLPDQVAQAQLDTDFGQPWAPAAVKPRAGIVGDQPTAMVGLGLGLRGLAAFGNGLVSGCVHLPSIPFSALSSWGASFEPPAFCSTVSLSFLSRLRFSTSVT